MSITVFIIICIGIIMIIGIFIYIFCKLIQRKVDIVNDRAIVDKEQMTRSFSYDKDLPEILEFEYEVKESTIPGAGDGVFAKSYVEKDEIFLKDSSGVTVNNVYIKDGDHTELLYKMNDAAYNRNLDEYYDNVKDNNVGFMFANDVASNNSTLYTFALKHIKPGDELFKFYGKRYWRSYICSK